ncbi:hypothetical protein [Kitasatospora cheerisanensis]|uniref:Uncharacterized protein n=1 Tax=Kitasatospora cheerisanensis KCTC 2395 TaxID=1348663 RepID=A0A066Z4P1_9ACTN|nr:hypothetical protein [Kitasatospora cheerisanensis]KDN85316.1 hypothetical protein KCH_28970 [Kitasatospora cheerisanensis KCTC 2395]
MDVVYASLTRREPGRASPEEAGEVVEVLWAHARPADALQHITARSESDRLDLLLYLLTRHPADGPSTSVATAHALIARGHRNSPLLARRYHAPTPASC